MSTGALVVWIVLGVLAVWLVACMLRAASKPRTTPKIRRDRRQLAERTWGRFYRFLVWWT